MGTIIGASIFIFSMITICLIMYKVDSMKIRKKEKKLAKEYANDGLARCFICEYHKARTIDGYLNENCLFSPQTVELYNYLNGPYDVKETKKPEVKNKNNDCPDFKIFTYLEELL